MSSTSSSDSLTSLLSMPLPFTIDPMATLQCESSSSGYLFPLLPIKTDDDASSMSSSPSSPSSLSLSPSLSPKDKKKISKPVVKKSRISLEDKDQKTKERILRNRAAAQESRDKKRRYVADLESNNKKLTEENEMMNKKLKLMESQNHLLLAQLAQLHAHLAKDAAVTASSTASDSASLLAHGFCDSARIARGHGPLSALPLRLAA
ncbi:hypothetical protein BC940DRAFT_328554 [Gongronella butleri]|nr:hypothetical protein BC940DRAFT_328554 [Gongronella butleri]